MSQDTEPNGSYADSADLAGRRDALRRAATRPGADARVLLEAAFAELDSAVDSTAAMSRRMDMVTAVTGLLLDNSTFSEAVTVQRCARLLAGEIASWVIIDIERSGELKRQFAIGPPGDQPDELARMIRDVDPLPGSVPGQVHATGRAIVVPGPDGAGILGTAPDGTPLPALLGAAALLSVPICDGEDGYGVLTLARQPAEGRFTAADLALAGELGRHLGVAIRVDRMFRHRSAVAEALQGSLLPARLPDVPGLELSAAYIPAGENLEVSGDFYDVFPVQDGWWAVVVGDVCGKGQEAAAMTAAARHAIRAIAHWNPDPVDVLARANQVILAGGYEDRFITVKLAYLRRDGDQVKAVLASSGHPGPAVIRPDGQVEVLAGGGLPLGLFPDAGPERETVELGPGDQLFFYSDGVTEARSPDQRYFEDDLAAGLAGTAGRPAVQTVRAVQDLVSRFSQDNLRDDMTILVIRVLPGGQHLPYFFLPARLGPARLGLRLLGAVGGDDLGGDLGDLDVAALRFLAQALERLLGVTAEGVHQDALGLVHHRTRHHRVLELAGGPLDLAVGGGVGEHRPAEGGQHAGHRDGLGVKDAGTHAE
ncbi:MAG TPA: PP2C family protein-serine/threonine phosphatase [Streptosporangiaceae bacterium]|nr:PP2C family protein-serine/threonine phosphatase [Streptosporangiaceae bacterium]